MKPPSTNSCYNFRVITVDKIVDGDTIDVTFDLGFGISIIVIISMLIIIVSTFLPIYNKLP